MKVLDSSFLIAILCDIDCSKIIDDLLKLNHKLVVSYSVCQEVIFGAAGTILQCLINDNKIDAMQLNTIDEIEDLQVTYPYLGFGELDSMITYAKLSQKENSIHCILDDKAARKVAKDRNVSLIGTIGLLDLMKNREAISHDEHTEILKQLRSSGFRMPKEFVK